MQEIRTNERSARQIECAFAIRVEQYGADNWAYDASQLRKHHRNANSHRSEEMEDKHRKVSSLTSDWVIALPWGDNTRIWSRDTESVLESLWKECAIHDLRSSCSTLTKRTHCATGCIARFYTYVTASRAVMCITLFALDKFPQSIYLWY